MSKESAVSTVVANAIKSVHAALGFDKPGGNVAEYRLEHEAEELQAALLMAECGGKKRVRLWTVWVTAADDYDRGATGGLMFRQYSILVEGYYEQGVRGEGVTKMRDGWRVIRGALREVGSRLGGTVDTIGPMPELQIGFLDGTDPDDGRIIRGGAQIIATRKNPEF